MVRGRRGAMSWKVEQFNAAMKSSLDYVPLMSHLDITGYRSKSPTVNEISTIWDRPISDWTRTWRGDAGSRLSG